MADVVVAVVAVDPVVAVLAAASTAGLVVLSEVVVVAAVVVVPRVPSGAVAAAVGVVSPVSSAGKSLMKCKHRWLAVCASARAMARPSDCAVVLR
ncbi:hypothetical protein OYC58_001614 [Cutibacterium acnes]|nr:hypothetical protein OYC58_001614 [Cutibacterium acnes]